MSGGAWPDDPPPRFILHRMMRRDQLCPGVFECPYVLMNEAFPTEDSAPCSECPKACLDDYMGSPLGQRIFAVLALEFAIRSGIQVTLEEISYSEFLLLQILFEERARWEREEIEAAGNRRGLEQNIHTNRP